jgi:hypothetical protein
MVVQFRTLSTDRSCAKTSVCCTFVRMRVSLFFVVQPNSCPDHQARIIKVLFLASAERVSIQTMLMVKLVLI